MPNQNSKLIFKNEHRLRGFWDNSKQINMHLMGVPEGEGREQGTENLSEENDRKFSNLLKK